MKKFVLGFLFVCSVFVSAQSLPGSITPVAVVGTSLDITTDRGRDVFRGNEQTLASLGDDPPKLRLAAPVGTYGCVSYNQSHILDPLDHHEKAMICAKPAEDGLGGGQLEFWVEGRYGTGDSAIRKMIVISPAFTTDGIPVVRMYPNLGPFAEGAPPVPSVPVQPPSPLPPIGPIAEGDFVALAAAYGFASGEEALYYSGRWTWEQIVADMEHRR